ncbi:MAG: PilW family protein [Methylobacter sp.]
MNRHQQGYTLIELMVSLLLGLMLIAGFGSLFVLTQKNATTQRSLNYMMEDGRYILEAFGKELRRSGFLRNKLDVIGGGSANDVFLADSDVLGSGLNFSAGDYIMGNYNATGFGAAADKPYNINLLLLRYQLSANTELAVNDPSSDNSPCTRSIHLTAGEDPATEVHVVTLYFYVALDSTKVPVLYCRAKRQNLDDPTQDRPANANTNPPAAEPLISNVQKLVITYGIDTNADGAANYYVDADSVPDWQQVVAAKLSVVLRSEDNNLTTSSISYTIDGTTYTAADNRMYRVSSSTIAFRNKI